MSFTKIALTFVGLLYLSRHAAGNFTAKVKVSEYDLSKGILMIFEVLTPDYFKSLCLF